MLDMPAQPQQEIPPQHCFVISSISSENNSNNGEIEILSYKDEEGFLASEDEDFVDLVSDDDDLQMDTGLAVAESKRLLKILENSLC